MKKLLILLIMGVSMIFFACSENNPISPEMNQNDPGTNFLAKKPAPNLLGIMELDFTFGEWPEEPVWVGTVTFEEFGTYGIRFFHLSPFKGYSQASPFEEYFEVYDLSDPSIVYLGGPDEGVTTAANKPPEPCKYRMNGEIDVAEQPFSEWMGRNVHMSGEITWQILETPEGPVVAPATAPGIMRVN